MSTPTIRPPALALAATTALLIGAPAVTAQAGPSRFYACVKKNGAARIAKKKLRCRKGESKLSWSSSGPAGRNRTSGVNGKDGANGTNGINGAPGVAGRNGLDGTTGMNGKDGANGAVAGFATPPMTEGVVFTTASEGSPQTIVSMTLPAGSFIANAKVEALLSDTKAGGRANVGCRLLDAPSGGGASMSDTANWAAVLDFPFIAVELAQNTLPLTLAVDSSGQPSTLSLVCWVGVKEAAGGTFAAEANHASITAVQTMSNS
jgi:hypothetical protein